MAFGSTISPSIPSDDDTQEHWCKFSNPIRNKKVPFAGKQILRGDFLCHSFVSGEVLCLNQAGNPSLNIMSAACVLHTAKKILSTILNPLLPLLWFIDEGLHVGLDLLHVVHHAPSFTSGNPATEVRRESSPASADALRTTRQSTALRTALEPIVAMAVCATVLTARIPAAFHHFMD